MRVSSLHDGRKLQENVRAKMILVRFTWRDRVRMIVVRGVNIVESYFEKFRKNSFQKQNNVTGIIYEKLYFYTDKKIKGKELFVHLLL